MAEKVTLKKPDGTIVYPQTQVDTPEIYNAAVTSAKIDWSTIVPVNYSTTEKATGGKWIGGKTIYQKTVYLGSLPNATSKTTSHGISNLDKVIAVQGFASSSSGVRITLPFSSTSNVADQVAFRIEASNIVVMAGSNRSSFSGYMTLWYTKTS